MSNESFNLSPSVDFVLQRQDELLFLLGNHPDKRIFIWGAGNNGKMVARLLTGTSRAVDGFYDVHAGRSVLGVPVLEEPTVFFSDQLILIAMNGPKVVTSRIKQCCDDAGVAWIHVVNADNAADASLCSARKTLADYKDIHKGRRCFVVGNGPSLNQLNMGQLKDELVFGSNRCFIGFEKWGVRFPYWGVEDPEVGGWQADEWKKLRGITKFVPSYMSHYVEQGDPDVCELNVQRIDFKEAHPLFSVYPDVLFGGRTVTYLLLQLAVVMGCSPIYLIGMDFCFTKTGTREEKNGAWWRQLGGDQNHFDSNYIPVGRFLSKPHWDLQQMAFESARHAGKLYGFDIYNATPGSKLDVFERVEFNCLF